MVRGWPGAEAGRYTQLPVGVSKCLLLDFV
jgi:hypothetical protein